MKANANGRIAVLGAGPAGLACAWELSRAGFPVALLERESRVGGLCQTLCWNDYRFDLGGHRFLTDNQELLFWVKERMGNALEERQRFSQIVNRGKWYRYPPQWSDVFRQGGPFFLAQASTSFLFHWLHRKLGSSGDATFENWVISRFGRPLYDLYFKEYSEKLWGIEGDRISSRWAAQRVSVPSLASAIRDLLPGRRGRPKTYASRFLYPLEGIGQICDVLAADIQKAGGTIRLGCEVQGLALEDRRVSGILFETEEEQATMQVAGCVSTLPLPGLLKGMDPLPSSALLEAAMKLTFRGLRFVFLSLDRPPLTPNTWVYVPEKEILFSRIQETARWEPSLAPQGKSGLILEVPCNPGDPVWQENLSSLTGRCLSQLKSLGLDLGETVIDVHDAFAPEAYPLYHVGFELDVARCLEAVAEVDNLLSTGRQGQFRYNNMDHSLEMGRRAAAFIQGNLSRKEALDVASRDVPFE